MVTKKSTKKGQVKGKFGKLAYTVSGKGKKTIFCLNGIGVSSWVWEPLVNYFSAHYKIVTWDYSGHGLSEKVKNPTKICFDDLSRDAFLIADHLKVKKAYLVGHSAGFHVALDMFQKRPAFVKGLISCLGSFGNTLSTFMDSFWGQVIFDVGYILNAVIPDISHAINANLLKNPSTYQIGAALKLVNPAIEGEDAIKKYLAQITNINFTLFNNLVLSESEHGTENILKKINVPTLLIASEYDRFVPMEKTIEAHNMAKNSHFFMIKNGTHAALLEQPDIFNLLIEKYLSPQS